MKKVHLFSASVVILIGLLHSFFGIFSAKEFNSEILWFISTGLLIMVVGVFNLMIASNRFHDLSIRASQIFNLFSTLFFTLLVIADSMLIGFILLASQILNSIASWKVIRERLNCCEKSSVHS